MCYLNSIGNLIIKPGKSKDVTSPDSLEGPPLEYKTVKEIQIKNQRNKQVGQAKAKLKHTHLQIW